MSIGICESWLLQNIVSNDLVGCYNIGYLFQAHLKPCKILFTHNSLLICQILLILCIENGGITAALCDLDEQNFPRFKWWVITESADIITWLLKTLTYYFFMQQYYNVIT